MRFLTERPRILTKVLLGTGMLVTASVALLSLFFLVRHQAAFQDQLHLRAESVAGSLASQSQFALLMNNRGDLERMAQAILSGDKDVAYVVVEDISGTPIVEAHGSNLNEPIPPAGTTDVTQASVRIVQAGKDGSPSIEAAVPVAAHAEGGIFGPHSASSEKLGRIRVAMSLKSQDALFQATLRQVCGIALLILLTSCLIGFVQIRKILRPLFELVHAAKLVGRGNYEIPSTVKGSDDEVGDLVDSFNEMVSQVAERTRELAEQVTAKELALAELAEAQQRLIDLSRRSGMAEIATSVLHNVGNVLNSVNVSATIVASKLRDSRVNRLSAVTDMLSDHSDDLNGFLRDDPKGQRVLPYLGNLSKHFEQERVAAIQELEQLTSHIGHIKQIVATQQGYAKVSGLREQMSLAELVEDAIRILESGFGRSQIDLRRDFEEIPQLYSDKHQILQILLNLLRNARQAVDESGTQERLIRVRIRRHGDDRVRIEVKDSGVGLSAENLTRIFAHGFTTKQGGHGFGLHSGALAAKQLGGALWAESDGPGRGATFTIELPLEAPQARHGRDENETVTVG